MDPRRIDTALFDLGGVVLRNGGPDDVMRGFPGQDPAVVLPIVMGEYHEDTDHPWHRLERGEISLLELWQASHATLIAAGLDGAFAPSGGMVFEPNDEMVELVRDLRGAGLKTGLLTNNVKELRERWWTVLPFTELFDDVVDSHEVGLRKPNPAIYLLALERLGAAPARTAFLDDMASNVAAAEKVGMIGVLVEHGGQAAIEQVRALAGLA